MRHLRAVDSRGSRCSLMRISRDDTNRAACWRREPRACALCTGKRGTLESDGLRVADRQLRRPRERPEGQDLQSDLQPRRPQLAARALPRRLPARRPGARRGVPAVQGRPRRRARPVQPERRVAARVARRVAERRDAAGPHGRGAGPRAQGLHDLRHGEALPPGLDARRGPRALRPRRRGAALRPRPRGRGRRKGQEEAGPAAAPELAEVQRIVEGHALLLADGHAAQPQVRAGRHAHHDQISTGEDARVEDAEEA